jgi:anti-sigma B factor antagonist
MTLRTKTRQEDGVAIIQLEGRITLGEGSGTVRDAVKHTLAQGHRRIVLDLAGVSYVDSGGLGELVGCFATATSQGAVVRLLHLQSKVRGLLQITKLSTVFETYEDEKAALRSFETSGVAGRG